MAYRYLSPAVHGRWRETKEEAIRDALRVRLAYEDPEGPLDIVLRPGVTIQEDDPSVPQSLN